MNIICEIIITDFFKLSLGYIALVGNVVPDIEKFIPKCKADLYINEKKIKTINLVGEDRFSGVDEEKRQRRRSVRTKDDIISALNSADDKEIKLIIYQD